DVLIAALAQLPPDVQLVLPGPYHTLQANLPDELGQLIARYGLEGRVHLPGATDAPETYVRAADLFAMPSEQEGMPNALLEAMACGLPCCASEIGGVVDVLTDAKNGLLSAAGDADALAANLRMLLDNPVRARALGQAARDTIQQRYTWSSIVPQVEALYAQLALKQ
ncbi:MAG: glycosyltransferase family 4 protein, partial [Anaerolineae bacterium]|nr:glycosyltransferase family 4 protein [Anaerolineae bacterium]